ncbi:MAG: O-antigen ligase domain-containing protein [Yoonia sp.]|uniref:O-antigen ligase family protein n=1 Tax=Yoonia sp. TaxID=2212373 RepID=UPI0032663B04
MTLPERIASKTLVWTWGFYAFGSLYVVGPVLAWILGALAVLGLYLGPAMREDLRPTGPIPAMIWLWIAGMSVMLVALWVGHLDWNLGLKGTIKSSIGWAKGWALLALFPFAGAILQINRDVLIRAHCRLALITLIITPVLFVAPMIGLPERIFTSPLKAVGGPGPEYFTVYFYTLDPSTWTPRWQFYAPWSPFAGLLGVIMVLFALEEKHRGWLIAGCLAGVAMILLSKSRMSLVALVVASVAPRMMPLLLRTWAWMIGAAIVGSMAVFWTPLNNAITRFWSAFKSSRADSTRVRETLQRIAHERWEAEAFWFGHGKVASGTHIVEYMPIGSHHTWWGLLFVKGLVGFLAMAVPFAVHLCITLKDAAVHPQGRLPLGIMIVFLILSMGENIEIEAYLMWPALMLLGIHLREMAERAPRISPSAPAPQLQPA